MKHDSPIFGPLLKAGEINDATHDQDELSKTTDHYLHKATNGPMIKVTPGGYGERTGNPSSVSRQSANGSISGDASGQESDADTTLDVIVDSTTLDTKVRELVQGAGAAYDFKRALQNGTAIKVDPQFAPAVVVNHSLSSAAQNLQRNAGLLTALIAKAQRRRQSGSASGSGSSTSAAGGTSSDDDTYNVDGEVMDKTQLAARIKTYIMQGLSHYMVRSNVDPRRLSAGQLASLMKTVPAGSPIHRALNRTMAKARYA